MVLLVFWKNLRNLVCNFKSRFRDKFRNFLSAVLERTFADVVLGMAYCVFHSSLFARSLGAV